MLDRWCAIAAGLAIRWAGSFVSPDNVVNLVSCTRVGRSSCRAVCSTNSIARSGFGLPWLLPYLPWLLSSSKSILAGKRRDPDHPLLRVTLIQTLVSELVRSLQRCVLLRVALVYSGINHEKH